MDYIQILKQKLTKLQMELVKLVPEMILAILLFFIFLYLSRLARKYAAGYLERRTEDVLLANFLSKTLFFILLGFGMVTCLGVLGLSGTVTKILAGAGISGFIIGFAFKDIGENFLAGILLAFKRPFSIGDTIETNGIVGTVYDFKLRETLIKTSEGIDTFIPNSFIIKSPLKNHTMHHLLRKEFTIGIDYLDDAGKALKMTEDILLRTDDVEKTPKAPQVVITEFGEKYIFIKALFWLNTSRNAAAVQSVVMSKILDTLKAEGYNLERK